MDGRHSAILTDQQGRSGLQHPPAHTAAPARRCIRFDHTYFRGPSPPFSPPPPLANHRHWRRHLEFATNIQLSRHAREFLVSVEVTFPILPLRRIREDDQATDDSFASHVVPSRGDRLLIRMIRSGPRSARSHWLTGPFGIIDRSNRQQETRLWHHGGPQWLNDFLGFGEGGRSENWWRRIF